MIRTELVLHTVETGVEDIIFTTDVRIEAPNWSPCGTFLIVNGGGLIYRLDLNDPTGLRHVDTGSVQSCNNDHGLSPDGRQLVICDSPGRGTSLIYILPVEGGTPKQITPLAPSYWHGWSPDGARLTYTARRDGIFHICTCNVDGSDEQVLTEGPGHRDGPDYTPDGNWIWFNSDHHGAGADLWRMRPDGSELQQMTDDAFVNWFPHPCPHGDRILYLAYPEGTLGHPADLDVGLRLLPAEGGPAREITRFRGGQGTINVPCWSPDGARFAYARYPEVA